MYQSFQSLRQKPQEAFHDCLELADGKTDVC